MSSRLLVRMSMALAIVPLPLHALTSSEILDKVKVSTVTIKTLNEKGEVIGEGTGVVLPSGKIATTCDVVIGGASVVVIHAETSVPANFYAGDKERNICVLKADMLTETLGQFAKPPALNAGESVYAIGNSPGREPSLLEGIISQLRASDPPIIETTVTISPNASGGGLFDTEGRLVGFTTISIHQGQHGAFAVPVEWLEDAKPGKIITSAPGQEDWTSRAAALEGNKDWSGLLDLAGQWIRSEPDNARAWTSMGNAYSGLAQFDQGIRAYRKALQIDPSIAMTWNNRVGPDRPLERRDDEITAYRQALRINSIDANAWNALGLAYRRINRHNDAVTSYREALRIDPKFAMAWSNLAIDTYLSGDKAGALQAVKRLQALDPPKAEMLMNLIVPH
ncbi:MAG: tetratricopeptide repeat-containing serine protease family protein [Thiobacillaceae bacterium]